MFNQSPNSKPHHIDRLVLETGREEEHHKSNAETPALSANGQPRKRILIIDDDPDFLTAIRVWFEKDRFEVLLAPNGECGYKILRETGPVDIVLTDFMMPELNGIELLRVITSDITMLRTPIVIMSNNSSPEFQLRAHRLGAIDYLLKASGARAIAEKVASLIASTSSERLSTQAHGSSSAVQAMRSSLLSLIRLSAQCDGLPIQAKHALGSAEKLVEKLFIAAPEGAA